MAVKCLSDGQEVRELRYAVISANTPVEKKGRERDFYNHFVVIKALYNE